MRLLLALLGMTFAGLPTATAQTTTALGTKPVETATAGAAKPADGKAAVVEDDSIVITPFRSLTLPVAKTTKTFQLAKLNKPLATETTKDLQRLFSAYALQSIVDGSPAGFSKATGYITTVNYSILQDLGDNRFMAKAAWPAAGPNDALAAGVDAWAVLLLDHPAKVGDTGKITGMHAGTAAVLLTVKFAPLDGKRLTLRREAFVECATLEDSPAGLQKFIDSINHGADVSVTTNELIPCKKCGGLGFIRQTVKGQLLDNRLPCTVCDGAKTVVLPTETKIIP
ncbi:MAG: hypothetical protein WCJ96_07995 [Verrucomicrobiota bacterium]